MRGMMLPTQNTKINCTVDVFAHPWVFLRQLSLFPNSYRVYFCQVTTHIFISRVSSFSPSWETSSPTVMHHQCLSHAVSLSSPACMPACRLSGVGTDPITIPLWPPGCLHPSPSAPRPSTLLRWWAPGEAWGTLGHPKPHFPWVSYGGFGPQMLTGRPAVRAEHGGSTTWMLSPPQDQGDNSVRHNPRSGHSQSPSEIHFHLGCFLYPGNLSLSPVHSVTPFPSTRQCISSKTPFYW